MVFGNISCLQSNDWNGEKKERPGWATVWLIWHEEVPQACIIKTSLNKPYKDKQPLKHSSFLFCYSCFSSLVIPFLSSGLWTNTAIVVWVSLVTPVFPWRPGKSKKLLHPSDTTWPNHQSRNLKRKKKKRNCHIKVSCPGAGTHWITH